MLEGVTSRTRQDFKCGARKGGAGPAGGRFEHWAPLGSDGPGGALAAATLARCLVGNAPAPDLRTSLGARRAGTSQAVDHSNY